MLTYPLGLSPAGVGIGAVVTAVVKAIIVAVVAVILVVAMRVVAAVAKAEDIAFHSIFDHTIRSIERCR